MDQFKHSEAESTMDRWYRKRGSQVEGPFTFSDLQFLASRGKLASDVQVRDGESGDWVVAKSVDHLFASPSCSDVAQSLTGGVVEPETISAMSGKAIIDDPSVGLDGNERSAKHSAVKDPSMKSGATPPLPPPMPLPRDDRNKRILIGSTIGGGIALLLLLLLFLFNQARTGVAIASRGVGSNALVAKNDKNNGSRAGVSKGAGRPSSKPAKATKRNGQQEQNGGGEKQKKESPAIDEPAVDEPDLEIVDDASQKTQTGPEEKRVDQERSAFRIERLVPRNASSQDGPEDAGQGADKDDRVRKTESVSGSFAPGFSERLAVTPVGSDDIGAVLRQLGTGYDRFTNIPTNDLQDSNKLKTFDVIFVNCGANPTPSKRLRTSLQQFVKRGGTIYSSDLQYSMVQFCFPESKPQPGSSCMPQQVKASVVDKGLIKLLGKTIHLNFDAGGWRVADFYGKSVTTLIKGPVRGRQGRVPLLVRFPFGKGSVIFTSFHNSAQTSETEAILLRYLVFSSVTAATNAEVARNLDRRGMALDTSDLLSTSDSARTFTRDYDCKQAGRLEFILAFEDLGAKLRLQLEGPNGERFKKEGTSTFYIEIPAAKTGEWKCIVTALEVPFVNFPFTLDIANEKN